MSTDNHETETDKKSPGTIIFKWWAQHIGNRETASARGLAARLNRADAVGALSEPAVHALMQSLDWRPTPWHVEVLLRLALVLPQVREHTHASLAQRLGAGDPPAMSTLRFQRLIRADGEELVTALRRALPLVDRRCNVAALGRDLVYWSQRDDSVRTRWCFDYFGAVAPAATTETLATEEEIT